MKQILLILFFSLWSIIAKSQTIDTLGSSFLYKNSVHTELLGNGSVYSFSYERILLNGQKFKTSMVLGGAMLPPPWDAEFLVNILLNELITFSNHHVEIGIGYGIVYEGNSEPYDGGHFGYFTGRLCYRYQKPNGRFVTRIGFTPFIVQNSQKDIFFKPWGGVSFGYNFGKK